MPRRAGLNVDSAGILEILSRPDTGITRHINGVGVDVNGSVYYALTTTTIPTVRRGGLLWTVDGALVITFTDPGNTRVVNGMKVALSGALYVSTAGPSTTSFYTFDPILGSLLVSAGGAVHVQDTWQASTQNLLPNGFSLPRASIGTYFDSAGLLQTAAIDAARGTYCYNGSTWDLDGTIVEAAATNLIPRSTKMADVTAWAANFTAITADQSVYLDGTTTMAALAPSNVVGLASPYFYEYPNPGITVPANTEYCVSVDVKRKAGTMGLRVWWVISGLLSGVRADFDLTGVTASAITTVGTGSSTGTPRIEDQGGGIYRVSLSGKLDAASTVGFLAVEATKGYQDGTAYTPNGTDGFFVAGAQVELGTAPTSRIVTAAAAVTRSPDVLTAPTAGLLVNGQGFAAIKGRVIANIGVNQSYLSTFAGAGEGAAIYQDISGMGVYDGVVRNWNAVSPLTAPLAGVTFNIATTWGGVTCNGAYNGTIGTPQTFDGSMDFGVTQRIGSDPAGTQAISIVLQSLRLGLNKVSDGQLAQMTT